jgi:transposase
VPYALVRELVDIRYTDRTVEILHKNKRVASHQRNDARGQFTTTTDHMPNNHKYYNGWTQERFMTWANRIGPSTANVIHHVLHSRKHLFQSFRSCLGILNLAKKYTNVRLEDAARKTLSINAFSYKSIANILKNNLEQHPLPEKPKTINIQHENIRGQQYFTNPVNIKEVLPCLFTQLKKNCAS